jgi:hypothetical protein
MIRWLLMMFHGSEYFSRCRVSALRELLSPLVLGFDFFSMHYVLIAYWYIYLCVISWVGLMCSGLGFSCHRDCGQWSLRL